MSKVTPTTSVSNSNLLITVAAIGAAAVTTRFVWKRFKNRKATK